MVSTLLTRHALDSRDLHKAKLPTCHHSPTTIPTRTPRHNSISRAHSQVATHLAVTTTTLMNTNGRAAAFFARLPNPLVRADARPSAFLTLYFTCVGESHDQRGREGGREGGVACARAGESAED